MILRSRKIGCVWKTGFVKFGHKLCCGYSNVKDCSKLTNELNIFELLFTLIMLASLLPSPQLFSLALLISHRLPLVHLWKLYWYQHN